MSKPSRPAAKPDHARAWGDFWSRNKGGSGDSGGCLPARWAGIEDVQKGAWQRFAADLPKNARVLDLATGDGRVMRWLLHERRDLKLIGSDLAPSLPQAPKGTKLRAGVAMEDMPFADGQFDACVSQFGFEYGDTAKAAAELARVVSPGGKVGLMTHRLDGPILAHNVSRRAGIAWAIEEHKLVSKAKGSLRMRAMGGPAVPPLIANAPLEGAAEHGEGSAAWEIAEAIRQTLAMGARDHPGRVAATLDEIGKQAENEMGRIASLEAACVAAASPEFSAMLCEAGLEERETVELGEPDGGRIFADFRIFDRR